MTPQQRNIDGLDYQTGISPLRVTNVHGSIARVSCEGCGKEMPFDDFCAKVQANIKDSVVPAASDGLQLWI